MIPKVSDKNTFVSAQLLWVSFWKQLSWLLYFREDVGCGWRHFRARMGDDLLPRSKVVGMIHWTESLRSLLAVSQRPEASVLCHVIFFIRQLVTLATSIRASK